jgi:hypothetical protein
MKSMTLELPDGIYGAVVRTAAGAGRSGDPRSADNDRIDADLAREYMDNHDETAEPEGA